MLARQLLNDILSRLIGIRVVTARKLNKLTTRIEHAEHFTTQAEGHAEQAEQPQYAYLGNREALVRLKSGSLILVDCDDVGITIPIIVHRCWEPHVESVMRRHIKQGQIAIDVGAHCGYHTLVKASLVGEKGRVLAFEPQSKNYLLLTKSVFLNDYAQRVSLFNIALGAAEGTARIRVHPWLTGGGNMDYPGSSNLQEWKTYDVPVRRLDNVLRENKIAAVDFIKIDAEGSEASIIDGIGDYLDNPTLKIIMVWSVPQLSSRGDPRALIKKLHHSGFSIVEIRTDGTLITRNEDELMTIRHTDLFLSRSASGSDGAEVGTA